MEERRLIDANKLIDFIDVGHLRNSGELCYSEVDVANLLLHAPTFDAVEVVRCRECKHSTLPSALTQRYGKPGTLTCHNMHAPSNRRNVGSNDFCSYGEPKEEFYRRADNDSNQ